MLLELHKLIPVQTVYELSKYITTSASFYINDQSSINSLQIINCLLEQILSLINILKTYSCIHTRNTILDFIKNNENKLHTFTPSNKFKFIDIIEKMKPVNVFKCKAK